jgi:hypothetical protein
MYDSANRNRIGKLEEIVLLLISVTGSVVSGYRFCKVR